MVMPANACSCYFCDYPPLVAHTWLVESDHDIAYPACEPCSKKPYPLSQMDEVGAEFKIRLRGGWQSVVESLAIR